MQAFSSARIGSDDIKIPLKSIYKLSFSLCKTSYLRF